MQQAVDPEDILPDPQYDDHILEEVIGWYHGRDEDHGKVNETPLREVTCEYKHHLYHNLRQ